MTDIIRELITVKETIKAQVRKSYTEVKIVQKALSEATTENKDSKRI